MNTTNPCLVLNANDFLRDALFGREAFNPYSYCHRPIIVRDSATLLGKVLARLSIHGDTELDDVIDHDLILLWSDEKRVITGADILGRLMRGTGMQDIRRSQSDLSKH